MGWEWPKNKAKDMMNPCSMPTCEPTCVNGECLSPNDCACEIGWEGAHCDICISLPGCEHGSCVDNSTGTPESKALECFCNEGWSGGYCDIRKYLFT